MLRVCTILLHLHNIKDFYYYFYDSQNRVVTRCFFFVEHVGTISFYALQKKHGGSNMCFTSRNNIVETMCFLMCGNTEWKQYMFLRFQNIEEI